jgi:hypothetical protein
METSTTQIMYPIIFAFCYMVTMCLIAYIATLIFKHSQKFPPPNVDNENANLSNGAK